MKRAQILSVIVAAVVLTTTFGCAARKGPPDPAKVQQKIEQTRSGERQVIVGTISDPEKVSALMDLLTERDRLVASHTESVQSYRKQMQALNENYDASRDDFKQAISDYNAFRRQSQKEFLELIAEMKAATTAEQWKELSKYQLKKLNPRDLVYSGEGT